jgi:hypothetical protein
LSFNPPADKSASLPLRQKKRRIKKYGRQEERRVIVPEAGNGLISLRLINSPPFGEIMGIPIDTPLLCGGVVHFVLVIKNNESILK